MADGTDVADEFPQARPYTDRHGKARWRFRAVGKYIALPESPGHPRFALAYEAAEKGLPAPALATVTTLPTRASPRSLRAAWRIYTTTAIDWKSNAEETRKRQNDIAEEFLKRPIVADATETWGEMPVPDLKRRHIKLIIAEHAATPHKARHLVGVIRKMIEAALDEEWIEFDPTHKVKHRPAYKGWRAWTDAECEMFETKWPIGTTPRLVYAVALWLGNRRADVATLLLKERITTRDESGKVALDEDGNAVLDEFRFQQGKGKRDLVLPVTPMLRDVLEGTELPGPTVVVTAYGKPFSIKSLSGRMFDWTRAAGLPPGCVLHGLRKRLGATLANSGASTRQIMDTLGHTDIKHAELYSKEAEQIRLARDGMASVVQFMKPNKVKG